MTPVATTPLPMSTGTIHMVDAGPVPLDLMTLRALDRLRGAEVVVYDRLISAEVLAQIPPTALRVQVGKALGDHDDHEVPQEGIHDLLVAHAMQGKRVVRLKGGDPYGFGLGGEEVQALQAVGIACEVLPGITAADSEPQAPSCAHGFSAAESRAVYRAIFERRDMRHFAGGSVAPDVMRRLLTAAHHAPSVGFMQPWRFVRVASRALRVQLHALVEQERVLTAAALGERADTFMQLKVEGLLECAELWAVALADGREAHVFGRRTLPQMDLASAACAIQNLWLAARAEGLGVGWVSMFDPAAVANLLQMPAGAEPIALLSIGPVPAFYDEPMLQQQRWAQRAPLDNLLFEERWGQPLASPSMHNSQSQ